MRDERYRLDAKGKLFDLQVDPFQKKPIENQKVKKRLAESLRQIRKGAESENMALKATSAGAGQFRIGDPSHRNTQLPARDAEATGQIKRSNKFPNSSWFTNWVDSDDYIFWEVDVFQGGQFVVDIYYALDESDVGVELSLSAGDASAICLIHEANQSPLIGAAQDRSPRKESLMKNFKPVRLGPIALSQGRQRLKLETKSITGEQSIDFSTLVLTKVGD